MSSNSATTATAKQVQHNFKSVAILGASQTPGKAGERRTRSLIESQFSGDIYPINPARESIFGIKAYASILDVPANSIDLAVILLSPNQIIEALSQCVTKQVKLVIIITAGEQVGSKVSLREQIEETIQASSTRVIGPNCSGMFLPSQNINLLGIPKVPAGKVGFISQSGNIIDSMIHFAQTRYFGFSAIYAAGNCYDIKPHHFLAALQADPNTNIIMCYLESIPDAEEFLRVARETSVIKPIIALVVGQTEAGKRSAHSHTKALAQDYLLTSSALYQTGVLQVDTPDEMASLATTLYNSPPAFGDRVVILSEGGGHNSIAADQIMLNGLTIPELSEGLQSQLKEHLLPSMPANNPIDYGGVAEENPSVIVRCVEILMQSDEVDIIVLTGFFGGFHEFIAEEVLPKEIEAAEQLAELVLKYKRPLIVQSCFAYSGVEPLEVLKELHVPVIESIKRTGELCRYISLYNELKVALQERRELKKLNCEKDKVSATLKSFVEQNRKVLLETESREILQDYHVPLVEAQFATSLDQVEKLAEAIGYPLAMKVVSPDVVHKSDAGAIALDIGNHEEALKAFEQIVSNASRFASPDRIKGVLISPMITEGVELIIGMVRDECFGPTLMLGVGGIYVEILKDVSFRVAPFYESDLDQIIYELQSAPILLGARGKPPVSLSALKQLMRSVITLFLDHPEILELDLNPILASESSVCVLDSRILIR